MLIRRLLKLAWSHRRACVIVIALQLVITVMALAGLGLIGVGIDYLRWTMDPTVDPPKWPFGIAPPPGMPPMQVIAWIGGGIIAIGLGHLLIFYLHQLATARLVHDHIVANLRKMVYRQLQRLSFRFFDSNESGSLINRVTGDVQAVRIFIDGVLLQLFALTITLGVFLFYMFNIHVLLTFACMASLPVLWSLSLTYSRVIRPLYLESRELMDRLILNFTEAIAGITTTRGFSLEAREITRFEASTEAVRRQRRTIIKINSAFRPSVEFLTQINIAILLGFGGWLAIRGELAVGTGLVVFARILQQFSNQVTAIAEVADGVQQSLTGARRVFEIMDSVPEVDTRPDALPLPSAKGHLVFENVHFHYDPPQSMGERDEPGDTAITGGNVLEDISFEAKPGQLVAVAGATGSGKTALLSLVPRFYDPQFGRILLDGHDLRDLRLDDLRHNVGVVYQENFLFSSTVRENIAFANPEATDEQIERAARIACAHPFIVESPDGYDTILGEAGLNLSGGQRQRLAIARALLHDPPVLILDDPTTAIDPETEHEILEAMERALEGRTTLIVAHRLSTLRRADHIIVLDKGRILQSGTHEELMHSRGPYRDSIQYQEVDPESREALANAPGAGA